MFRLSRIGFLRGMNLVLGFPAMLKGEFSITATSPIGFYVVGCCHDLKYNSPTAQCSL
jgi:hypothetical protein